MSEHFFCAINQKLVLESVILLCSEIYFLDSFVEFDAVDGGEKRKRLSLFYCRCLHVCFHTSVFFI